MRLPYKKGIKLKAFTLSELLVVLVIIGILVLLALPKLMPLISRAKSTEAQVQLGFLHMLQENYFYMYSSYSENLDAVTRIKYHLIMSLR